MNHEQVLRRIKNAIENQETPPNALQPKKVSHESFDSISIRVNQLSASFIVIGLLGIYHFEKEGNPLESFVLVAFMFAFFMLVFGLYRDFSGFDEKELAEIHEHRASTRASNNHHLANVMWEERYLSPLQNAVTELQKTNPELGVSVDRRGAITMNPEDGVEHDLLNAYKLRKSNP